MVSRDDGSPRAARDVLRYFLRNPRAADSLEGVARWRLMDEAIYRSVVETGDALRWLVASGYLTRDALSGGPAVFRLNPRHCRDAAAWVAAEEAAAAPPRAPRPNPPGAPRAARSGNRQGRNA